MKLFAWQPEGHGPLSWFVCAATEDEARAAVQREIERRRGLQIGDNARIDAYDIGGWPARYELTAVESGVVLDNRND